MARAAVNSAKFSASVGWQIWNAGVALPPESGSAAVRRSVDGGREGAGYLEAVRADDALNIWAISRTRRFSPIVPQHATCTLRATRRKDAAIDALNFTTKLK